MFEKVNPSHPDKLCDRIGGAIVDLGYKLKENPKVAGECMLGHGDCHIIIETDVNYDKKDIVDIVHRIAGKNVNVDLKIVPQDTHLSDNQKNEIRCGDNGIFRGCKSDYEELKLANYAKALYSLFPYDGKYIFVENDKVYDELIVCQSNAKKEELEKVLALTETGEIKINPLGDWTGGPDVDTGACNRKLGSDMGRAVTGGGLHFKDISKADVAINVYLHKLCEEEDYDSLECKCAIGDTEIFIDDLDKKVSYKEVTEEALKYINELGGFEKLAEWGLI